MYGTRQTFGNCFSINIMLLRSKENILFLTNICDETFNSPPPEEVYPAELRGIMLIENASQSVRRAPEEPVP
jgi:hypothetical protein